MTPFLRLTSLWQFRRQPASGSRALKDRGEITPTKQPVYPKYFGLKEPSFSIAPDPHYLFLSEQHKEALAHLLYGAGESGGFLLLTGEVGTGKTTVCRAFLEQLPDGVDVALILNPAMTANELLLNICDEFRIPVPEGERSVKRLVDRLNRYLLEAHANGRRPVLMIDEAQNLRPKVMEQVRLLTNLETTKNKLLQIFLVGQPELRRMLESEGLRQINQRITARFHLKPLTLAETGEYIRHRIAVAGVDRPLFTAAAIRRIHQISGGIPRLTNILCDRALLGACVTRANQVTPPIVAKAAREVRGDPIDAPPRPAVRPAFGIAAALTLALAAAWMGYGWLHGDPWQALTGWAQAEADPPTPEAGAPSIAARPVPKRPAVDEAPATIAAEPQAPSAAALEPAVAAVDEAPIEGPLESLTEPTAVEIPETEIDPAPAPGVIGAEQPPVIAESVPEPAADAGQESAPPALLEEPEPELPRISLASFEPGQAEDTIARLTLPEADALRLLLRHWKVDLGDAAVGDPCGYIGSFGLRCEQEQGKLSNVRFFDRPVLLRVPTSGGDRYAVLAELDESYGTFDLPSGSQQIPVEGIEAIWSGDYTVVWQPPPTGSAVIGPGSSVDAVRWLRNLLAEVPGATEESNNSGFFDRALASEIRAFQTSRGLAADGVAGPRTLIQLHNAVEMPGIPRLIPTPAPTGSATATVKAAGAP